ncbi:GNAT family N-acetyltransferase [Alsobacter sp. SYSU M60028]|uniref:GNAT family N-acetyltransferase n=1 Tax=Alsobacter ponti TaxID=2962936 RepID=A0ABT1L7P0_9HYPH|nr:GNAT family N-acetyltransferase [Alsobacter ponti]MCP8937499.1 GNAT family N-acetyltransferase [Alsobacter ponti]
MEVRLRPARVADIPDLAVFANEASAGLIEWLYRGAIPGRAANVIVEHVFTRFGTAMSFDRCVVAEVSDRVVGYMHVAAANDLMNGPPDALVAEERKRHFAPFAGLRTPGSFHVFGIYVDPDHRSGGVGRSLLAAAETRAAEAGCRLMALNVFGVNARARKLYEDVGYREARRVDVDVPGVYAGPLIHMTKPF